MARGLIEARSAADAPPSSRPLAELAVQVHEPGARPEQVDGDVQRLVAWIERQDAVRTVVHDADDGTIVLRYDTRKAPESLLRGAILDRLLAIRPKTEIIAKRVEVKIAHEVPGRVRLKVASAPPEAIERLASFIADGSLASSGPAHRPASARSSSCSTSGSRRRVRSSRRSRAPCRRRGPPRSRPRSPPTSKGPRPRLAPRFSSARSPVSSPRPS